MNQRVVRRVYFYFHFRANRRIGSRFPGSEDRRSGTYTKLTAGVVRILEKSMKPKTTKLYQRACGMFTTFTRGVYGKEIVVPLSESHIIMFIAHMEERGYARATIRTFISTLSYPHNMSSLPDPARGWVVKKMLDTVREGQG